MVQSRRTTEESCSFPLTHELGPDAGCQVGLYRPFSRQIFWLARARKAQVSFSDVNNSFIPLSWACRVTICEDEPAGIRSDLAAFKQPLLFTKCASSHPDWLWGEWSQLGVSEHTCNRWHESSSISPEEFWQKERKFDIIGLQQLRCLYYCDISGIPANKSSVMVK